MAVDMFNGLKIGEFARLAGVNLQTVRYYERQGLLPKPSRSPAGYRVFSSDNLHRLQFIRRAKRAGFSLIETPGGFDYTGDDCMGWMREVGFKETYVWHLVGPDSMVVGIK